MPFNQKMRRKVVDDASKFDSEVERVASMHWQQPPINTSPLVPPCRRTIELPSSSQKRPGFSLSLSLSLRSGEGCLGSESMAGIVVVFDFDKTIIDCDSDNWVVDGLGATELFERLVPTMPWNSLMDWMMAELHAQGRSIEDIADVLKMAPLDPHVITAIKSAYAVGCELKIVSDANTFFIETILQHHGLLGYFSEINTNPSYIDEEGKLRILPYHDFHKSSHNCINCPPNMCKGIILERIRVSAFAEGKKRFIYLGDGKGDYCPSLQLTEDDHVMPRKYFPLWELIANDPTLLKAEVHEWSDGEELERVLLHLINKSLSTDSNSSSELLSPDCKFHTISMSTHEPLLQALPVPH